MGMLNALGFVSESRPAPIDGSHALNSDRVHGASNPNAVMPDSCPDEAWDTIRPFPVWRGDRLLTPEEAGAIKEHCKDFKDNATATVSALDTMIETLDKPATKVNRKKQQYIRSEARFERNTIGAKHITGKYLQSQRPQYAKFGVDYQNAEMAADNAIAALSAQLG